MTGLVNPRFSVTLMHELDILYRFRFYDGYLWGIKRNQPGEARQEGPSLRDELLADPTPPPQSLTGRVI
ncbi:MAG: hypothetical protein Ct9H90mP5_10640 [Acidimicrobiaceae bacterium]|nr:MAG: hypothetical protein Ct9H90mP5_10640 [Acidimicrobiaceae bacterium]